MDQCSLVVHKINLNLIKNFIRSGKCMRCTQQDYKTTSGEITKSDRSSTLTYCRIIENTSD